MEISVPTESNRIGRADRVLAVPSRKRQYLTSGTKASPYYSANQITKKRHPLFE